MVGAGPVQKSFQLQSCIRRHVVEPVKRLKRPVFHEQATTERNGISLRGDPKDATDHHQTTTAVSENPEGRLDGGVSSEGNIYTERLLSGRQIRLLHIRPSSNPEEELTCDLETVELEDEPIYEALSYVWGVDPPTVPIICNGKRCNIRSNLVSGLQRLRLGHISRVIWADALYINQKDNEEKNHQVPHIWTVYSQAIRVVVWLGHYDEDVISEAFRCVRLFAGHVKNILHANDIPVWYMMDKSDASKAAYLAVKIPSASFTADMRRGFDTLYDCKWFSRVWCIQEI